MEGTFILENLQNLKQNPEIKLGNVQFIQWKKPKISHWETGLVSEVTNF